MALILTTPVRRVSYPYYPLPYPYSPYTLYRDPKYFAMTGDEQKIISGIAKVIVNNRKELIEKLDELEIACSCGLGDATEKDLSDIIVESIENKKLQEWLADKIAQKGKYSNAGADPVSAIASAIGSIFQFGTTAVGAGAANKARKAEYKNAITQAAINYKVEQEKNKRSEKTSNTLMIVGGAILLLGVGALIYFGTMKGQKPQMATA